MAAMMSSGRAVQREDMTLRMRRPPEEFVTLLSQSEPDFRDFVTSFEKHPLFQRLVKEGAIARVRLHGRIPRERYEEYMDRALVDFLRDKGITERPNWERDFLAPHALDRVAELAEKYEVSPGDLVRHLRYIRSSTLGNGQAGWVDMARAPGSHNDGPSPDERALDNTGSEARIDLTDIIETTREFVTRYEVSEQEFLDLILGGDSTAEELAERFECSLLEAEEVLEAADRVYLAQSYETDTTAPRSTISTSTITTDTPIAWVEIIDDKPSIQFHQDSVYAQRYHIRLPSAPKIKTEDGEETARDLLLRARLINQRLSALSRLITSLCAQQVDYLKSGDMRQLKPLAQAELAREMGEHPSTVSRLIRKKTIETPWGKIPLLFLCQSKTDVVARVISESPKLTDQEIVSKLREDYDCQIARRTVAYHRGKRLRRNKRRKTDDKDAKKDAS